MGMLGPRRSVLMLLGPVLATVLIACNGPDDSGGRRSGAGVTSPTSLPAVEIRDFEGKDLSSIGDFRENSIRGPQYVDKESYRLRIGGLVSTPTVLTYEQVIRGRERYQKVVRLDCVEGWSVDILWEGVLVRDVLSEAGIDARARTVIFRARDGYSSSLPVAYVTGSPIMMAYKMNGIALPSERGFPFQIVAEDKWGYKWVKWVEEIELSADEGYRGYWESRGYSIAGDRDEPPFGF